VFRAHSTLTHRQRWTAVLSVACAFALHAHSEEAASSSGARRHPLIADRAADSRHLELEELFTQGEAEKGLARTDELLKSAPDDPELLIHRFRFLFEKGERIARTDKSLDKLALYEEMLAITERGLKLAPDHPRFLWGRGIATARIGTQRGILASLRSATEIERLWSEVAASGYSYQSLGREEVLPCDAELALGMFYRMVPDWWIVGVIAGTKGDLDRSLALVEKSDRCQPGRLRAVKELGVTQLCIAHKRGDAEMRARGIETLTRARAFATTRPTDIIDVRHTEMLQRDPSLACTYSRDGQLEIDEKKLKR
jgi:tetratricopeptide (TPR) repeat protein